MAAVEDEVGEDMAAAAILRAADIVEDTGAEVEDMHHIRRWWVLIFDDGGFRGLPDNRGKC